MKRSFGRDAHCWHPSRRAVRVLVLVEMPRCKLCAYHPQYHYTAPFAWLIYEHQQSCKDTTLVAHIPAMRGLDKPRSGFLRLHGSARTLDLSQVAAVLPVRSSRRRPRA
jgi:hypothetical protein